MRGFFCWERKLSNIGHLSNRIVTRPVADFCRVSYGVLSHWNRLLAVVGTINTNGQAANRAKDYKRLNHHHVCFLNSNKRPARQLDLTEKGELIVKKNLKQEHSLMNKMINRPIWRKINVFFSLVMKVICSSWSPCGSYSTSPNHLKLCTSERPVLNKFNY